MANLPEVTVQVTLPESAKELVVLIGLILHRFDIGVVRQRLLLVLFLVLYGARKFLFFVELFGDTTHEHVLTQCQVSRLSFRCEHHELFTR